MVCNQEPPRAPDDNASRRRRINRRNFRRAACSVAIVAAALMLFYRISHVHPVVRVLDGDTFVIRYWGEQRLVQLAGADAPELHKNEFCAHQAKHFLEERILGKRVWLDFLDPGNRLDYKDRWLCWVWVGGENINYSLVAGGLAKFSGAAERQQRSRMVQLERQAHRQQRGLWATPNTRTAGFPANPDTLGTEKPTRDPL